MNTDHLPDDASDAQLEAHFYSYNPVNDVPSSFKIKGNLRLSEPTLAALSPEMRDRVTAKLAGVTNGNRDTFERQFIQEELRASSQRFRLIGGVGEGATETQKVHTQLANDIRLLETEQDRILAQLKEHRQVRDPVTGNMIDTPEKRVAGDMRTALEARFDEVSYQIGLKKGTEGERLRKEAIEADKAAFREARRQLAEDREARQLAEETTAKERVQKLAEGYAKGLRTGRG